MLALEASNVQERAREYALSFFELIALGDWAGALARIDRPTSYGRTWTRADIEHEIAAYGSCNLNVTSPTSATGEPHTSTGHFNDGSGFYFDFAVPLDGQWSDLTAQFEFRKHANGYAVVLEDIHVL
jgi:hypothetical protein